MNGYEIATTSIKGLQQCGRSLYFKNFYAGLPTARVYLATIVFFP